MAGPNVVGVRIDADAYLADIAVKGFHKGVVHEGGKLRTEDVEIIGPPPTRP